MKQSRPYPQVIISRKAARSLAAGHPWVFAGEVLDLRPSQTTGEPATNGCIVDVVEENGTWQGAGLLSEQSTIRVRILSRNTNDRFDEGFWRRRIEWAWRHRLSCMGERSLPNTKPDTQCCRVVFSEADGLPGLTVDRYGQVLVAQIGTTGMEQRREMLYTLLLDVLRESGEDVCALYERCDSPMRLKEGLELRKGWWESDQGKTAPSLGDIILVQENGIDFEIDLVNSQKTGFFLDQKYNRRAVRQLSRDRRVLDCFCHVGPFGLGAAAGGAQFVRCVDVSTTAIELAQRNARLNKLDNRMGFTCSNVLEYLPRLRRDRSLLHDEGGPFDLIVLDPPAFTKSRATVRNATKGYRDINCEAIRLLPRGGYLATCSCSQHMTRDLLAQAIADAAHIAGKQLKLVEERQQAPDHPILWGFPQSHYLDFFIFQVV